MTDFAGADPDRSRARLARRRCCRRKPTPRRCFDRCDALANSTPLSRRIATRCWRRRATPTRNARAARRWARCMACRWRSRTISIAPAMPPPAARRACAPTGPTRNAVGGAKAARCRRHRARQDQHARNGVRHHQQQRRVRRGAESLRPVPHSRRIERRHRRRGRRAPGARRHRQRHRRLGADSGGAVRHRRLAAEPRALADRRHPADLAQPRHCGPDRAHRRRIARCSTAS